MAWVVEFFDAFEVEFDVFPDEVQDAILARAALLEREGPQLGRPDADILRRSRHANMKELRCHAGGGVWRIALPLIPTGRPFCSRQEKNPAAVKSASTDA
jgi:hypothetical protein